MNHFRDPQTQERERQGRARVLLSLFAVFFKTGLFTFGGGYAMIALLENEFVRKQAFLTTDEFLDMTAIAEATPGPIAINCATYIGYRRARIPGAVTATVGICLPSLIIIYLIALFFDAFLSLTVVAYAFKGIQIGVIYLIASAGLRLFKKMKKTPANLVIFCAVLTVTILTSLLAKRFSAVILILICGGVGIFLYLLSIIKVHGKKAHGGKVSGGKEDEA